MKKLIGIGALLSAFILLFSSPGELNAHPGNTDSSGCHTCRTNCPDWGLSYGEYHCHNAKNSYQPEAPIRSTYGSGGTGYTEYWSDYEYKSSYDTAPTCPSNSYYDSLSGSCSCTYGYVAQGGQCVSGNSFCWNAHGYSSSYDSLSRSCKCDYGYALGSDGQCKSRDSICVDQFGYNSEYDVLSESCACKSGYVADVTGSSCISGDYYCHQKFGYNSSFDSYEERCECDYGYELRNGTCEPEETEGESVNLYEDVGVTDFYLPPPVSEKPPVPKKEEFKFDKNLLEVFPKNKSGSTNTNAIIRDCPSKACEVVRYYAEDVGLSIAGKYAGEWYQVIVSGAEGIFSGWMHESVVDLEGQLNVESKAEAAATTSPVIPSEENNWLPQVAKWLIRFLAL